MAAWLRVPNRSRTFAAVGIVAAIAAYGIWSYRELAPARSTISFVAPGGTLRVETATTSQERAAGLAGRAAPAADGLLLEWPAAGRFACAARRRPRASRADYLITRLLSARTGIVYPCRVATTRNRLPQQAIRTRNEQQLAQRTGLPCGTPGARQKTPRACLVD
jgi:hypothetical protein